MGGARLFCQVFALCLLIFHGTGLLRLFFTTLLVEHQIDNWFPRLCTYACAGFAGTFLWHYYD